MNKSIIMNDTVKIVEWVRYVKGERKISESNNYIKGLVEKQLKLDIGCNCVVSQQYKNTTYEYTTIKGETRTREKRTNNFNIAVLENLLTSCNIFLQDRQIGYYWNKLEQLTLVVLPITEKKDIFYITDKNCCISKYGFNFLTGEQQEITSSTRKGIRTIWNCMDYYSTEEFRKQAEQDRKEILLNLENLGLKELLAERVIVHKKESKQA